MPPSGPAVARLLRGTLPGDVEVAEHGGETTALIGRLDGVDAAYLVDACVSGATVGTVHRFDVAITTLPQGMFGLSSHSFGLAEAVELARALGQLPRRCIVYAIEGGTFDAGEPLSPSVQAAVVDVTRRLRAEIMGEDHREERRRA